MWKEKLDDSQEMCTYILQVKLELLFVGLKFVGQLITLMVECEQTL